MATDPFGPLSTDHRRAEALLARLAEEQGMTRLATLDELEDLLERHMELEEAVLYPAVRRHEHDPDAAREPQVEHGLIRDGLGDVRQLVALPGFGAAVDMLGGALHHHLDWEELELFPDLRRQLSAEEIDELARGLSAETSA
jgi:hemerythrin-like domain-containing protein